MSSFSQDEAVAKEIDSKTDLIQEESMPSEHRSYMSMAPSSPSSNTVSPDGNDLWPQGRGDMPQIKNLNVKCEKNHMKVNVEFDRPFYGTVFSKGHFNDPKCVHLAPGSGHVTANFDIFLGACGMSSSEASIPSASQGTGLYIENTVIIQYDAQVQEVWDQARRLRCTWYDFYEKAVTFKTFSVEMQDAVTANFLGDNIQCWMQIQAGKGPWASEVAGIVKIGQTMTMVLAIKDEENKFDMLVRNCVAHDGRHQPIQLVDDSGCVIRPKIFSRFHKVKNFGASATVVSYAYFQAFKFPDSMNVHFQCVIQVCRHECPEPVCERDSDGYVPPARGGDTDTRLVSVGNRIAAASNRVPVYRPAPPTSPAPVFNPHQFMHRSGYIPSNLSSTTNNSTKKNGNSYHANHNYNNSKEYTLNRTGGSPRSLKLRKRRGLENTEQMDIQTHEKVIQVVAPGDMAFSLSIAEVEDVNATTSSVSAIRLEDESSVCMSTASLVAGVVLLLLLLTISCLISVFLYMRVRQVAKVAYVYNESGLATTISTTTYDNPEFVNSLSYAGVAHHMTH